MPNEIRIPLNSELSEQRSSGIDVIRRGTHEKNIFLCLQRTCNIFLQNTR